jgi:precorrin-2 dehydrogenase / sirohydrochlorin ferrochelatase
MTERRPLLPVFMKMQDRPALVVGGGCIALEKIRVLLDSGATIRAVAPEALEEVKSLARDGKIILQEKEYSDKDLLGVSVVIAATNDFELNHRVYAEATARGQLVNVVDDPEYCDFYFGSIVRRGALQVAISTTGESPAFAQQLKQEIDEALPADTGSWLARLGELRRHINRVVEAGPGRISLLRELARREACDPATCPCRSLT